MEVKRTIFCLLRLVRFIGCLLLFAIAQKVLAQEPVKKYTVKSGNMYIEITKDINDAALDSFITQFDLHNLFLKDFLKKNVSDSLRKNGWKIEKNNEAGFIISKTFAPFDK